MKKLTQIVIATLIMVVLTLGVAIYNANFKAETPSFGSVSQTNGYDYVQFSGAIATSTLISAGRTMLGSVIITEDQVGAVMIYDATSTAAVGNGLTRTVADFQTAEPEGVYTFDTTLKYGLVMVSADGFSFAGDWTVTYRQGW